MLAGVFEVPASILGWFYTFSGDYAIAISLMAVLVMVVTAPLTLKSTKGMLEMQRLAPEMRKLQQEHRSDRQKLNEEMMKLYQEHKVNPMASCLPLVAQMPVFIIMFRILVGLTYKPRAAARPIAHGVLAAVGQPNGGEVGFVPRYLSTDSDLFRALVRKTEMNSFGIDLSKSTAQMLGENFGKGLIYALLVVVLGVLYFLQQRMVAARAAVSPTMSPSQQKLMQYLPVAFAVFQVFFLAGLVVYYIAQALLRIAMQGYITRRFYGHDESLGRQAQRAGEQARELAKKDGAGGGGLFGQARKDIADARGSGKTRATGSSGQKSAKKADTPPARPPSKRATPPKNRPTPASRPGGAAKRPKSSRPGGRPRTDRPKRP